MPAPLLTTDRLVLRPHQLDDFDPLSVMYATPAVYQHMEGKPLSRDDVWSRLLRSVGHWEILGFGFWVICAKSDGRVMGEAGFADFHRDIKPPLNGVPEVGWALRLEEHGQGFATEAVKRVIEWGDAHLQSKRTMALIDEDHVASAHVAHKCGYTEWNRSVYRGKRVVLWGRNSVADRAL
jgi:RimJ/RimL family protein N-acetyltransferase